MKGVVCLVLLSKFVLTLVDAASDIIAIHQFTYHQFTYFARKAGCNTAIRERDEGTVHITCPHVQ
jgi:hypothetical protein